LQQGQPELTPLGLPRVISGGFASVYKLQCQQRTWVVRCFLRPFQDHEHRYAAISDLLNRVRLPYTVGFTFLREGIRVRGQWYPILKMEWVRGERLDAFIEQHLEEPDTIMSLARHWFEMVQALRDASIAHGDLQHGNVLVTTNGELKLIDYDGMYIPELAGEGSHEVGHPHYQHPQRRLSDFGHYLDNFSAWVIYVSLMGCAIDPELWLKFRGDECLLFRRQDFEQPEDSAVLRALESHRDGRIRSLGTLFRSLLDLGPRDVPYLNDRILSIAHSQAATASANGSWIEDYIKPHPMASVFPDPRDASPANVRAALRRIIEEEGPLTKRFLIKRYVAGCRTLHRASKDVKHLLNRALYSMQKAGEIVIEDELGNRSLDSQVIRLAGAPRVKVRPAGQRGLLEIPPSELLLVLDRIHALYTNTAVDDEALVRDLLRHYGFTRLTEVRRKHLTKVLNLWYQQYDASSDSD
jgi:serine/threonine protein kinase